MSSKAKVAAVAGGVLLVAGGAFFLLSGKDVPLVGDIINTDPTNCQLTGIEPKKDSALERPAVAVKIENAAIAYPLSGLEDADIVYEEVVEGGVTRFLAVYHCSDTSKAGPVRSARFIDPSIMIPTTRILGFSGANRIVLDNLGSNDIIQIEETNAGDAMQRVPREGLSTEHTLYADSAALRKIGAKEFDDAPPDDMFEFGELEGKSKKASSITIQFSGATTVSYEWDGEQWARSQNGEAFVDEAGGQIGVDNVIVESHVVNLSETIVDVAGNPSIEIADETGSGTAVLFRDNKAIVGTWEREDVGAPVVFTTKAGDAMILKPGKTWIHLVPNDEGEVKGSFSFDR